MNINLYATFRLRAGVKTIALDLPDGSSLRQVIDCIVTRYPLLRKDWLDEAGELYAHVHIFINGKEVTGLTGELDTRMQNSDEIDFLPPVAGG